jgi:biopolymer transport protein ExbB/TolQ
MKRWALIAILPLTTLFRALAEDFPVPPASRLVEPELGSFLALGGPAMWPIFAVAVAGLVLTLERVINLRRSRHAPRNFHKEVVKVADTRGIDAALALCLEKSTSLSRVLYSALLRQGSARKEMEDAAIDEARRVLYDLRRNTRPLGVMSLLAFFLGLLGASVNAIAGLNEAGVSSAEEHFAMLTHAGMRGLVPFAFGLAAGIIMGILYFYLRGLASDLARDVEEMGIDAVVTLDR